MSNFSANLFKIGRKNSIVTWSYITTKIWFPKKRKLLDIVLLDDEKLLLNWYQNSLSYVKWASWMNLVSPILKYKLSSFITKPSFCLVSYWHSSSLYQKKIKGNLTNFSVHRKLALKVKSVSFELQREYIPNFCGLNFIICYLSARREINTQEHMLHLEKRISAQND